MRPRQDTAPEHTIDAEYEPSLELEERGPEPHAPTVADTFLMLDRINQVSPGEPSDAFDTEPNPGPSVAETFDALDRAQQDLGTPQIRAPWQPWQQRRPQP